MASSGIKARNLPATVQFGRETCGHLEKAEAKEWWLANGVGGYAAGTIAGTLTRRYHGLLIAPLHPPLGRTLMLAKADATVLDGNREWPLFANRWQGGAIDPSGHLHMESFRLDGRMPVWQYRIGPFRLEGRVWMVPGENATYIGYKLDNTSLDVNSQIKLRARLLVNLRDHHSQMEPNGFSPEVLESEGELHVNYAAGVALHIKSWGGSLQKDVHWVHNFDLPLERERGLPDRDNHLSVGEALLELLPGKWTGLCFSLGSAPNSLEEALSLSLNRDRSILANAEVKVAEIRAAPDWIRQLVLAADSFIFARPTKEVPEGESVIAGYPWFGDWGRDTMIALPGLTLATGRHETARRILMTFARYVDQGMLPNVFPEGGEPPQYNTVDASLWYLEAWRAYVEATGDLTSLKQAYPILRDMLDCYRAGTRFGIRMDPGDGLLFAGDRGVQLTWMDAKIGDWVVTPRIGKPVEINGLWYHAHLVVTDFAKMLGQKPDGYDELAARIRKGFSRFVIRDGMGLYDVIDGPGGNDPSIRPNQIFAVSLAHSPLDPETQKRVVGLCGRHLLTSFGLRSLSPDHPDYRPYYRGGVWERDSSYHQGPVWAWLLGHYAMAQFRVTGDAEWAQSLLEPICHHLNDAGLGQVSEIFDGAPPHEPRGCPAQAWSVACVLDAWWKLEQAKQQKRKAPLENG